MTEDILGLKTKSDRNGRRILPHEILIKANTNKIRGKHDTLIRGSFVVKTGRLFNVMPKELRDMQGVSLKTFKGRLDNWLRTVPDTPKLNGYAGMVAAGSNSLIDQARYAPKNTTN